MGTLFKYELKKVLSKKAYILAVLIMMAIILGNELTPVILGNYRTRKASELALSGTVINDICLATLTDEGEHGTTNPIEFFVKSATGSTYVSGWSEETLYSTRDEINASMMRKGKIPEKDIAVWQKWDSKNKAPYTYVYSGLYTSIFELSGYMNFILLISTAIGLGGLFAEEKATNMDQLIFCSKLGRKRLFAVKTAVGIAVGLITVTVMILTSLIIDLILYGPSGASMMLQLLIPACMLHLNMGQSVVIMILLYYLEEIALVIVIMFLSQVTMNKAVTISSMFVVMFMAMINIPSSFGLLYILWNSIPGSTVGSWLFDNYRLIHIFGIPVINMVYIPVIWLIFGTALIFITKKLYENYQVKSR